MLRPKLILGLVLLAATASAIDLGPGPGLSQEPGSDHTRLTAEQATGIKPTKNAAALCYLDWLTADFGSAQRDRRVFRIKTGQPTFVVLPRGEKAGAPALLITDGYVGTFTLPKSKIRPMSSGANEEVFNFDLQVPPELFRFNHNDRLLLTLRSGGSPDISIDLNAAHKGEESMDEMAFHKHDGPEEVKVTLLSEPKKIQSEIDVFAKLIKDKFDAAGRNLALLLKDLNPPGTPEGDSKEVIPGVSEATEHWLSHIAKLRSQLLALQRAKKECLEKHQFALP